MATYEVSGPNGEVYQVDGPDNAPPPMDRIKALVQQSTGGQPAQPDPSTVGQDIPPGGKPLAAVPILPPLAGSADPNKPMAAAPPPSASTAPQAQPRQPQPQASGDGSINVDPRKFAQSIGVLPTVNDDLTGDLKQTYGGAPTASDMLAVAPHGKFAVDALPSGSSDFDKDSANLGGVVYRPVVGGNMTVGFFRDSGNTPRFYGTKGERLGVGDPRVAKFLGVDHPDDDAAASVGGGLSEIWNDMFPADDSDDADHDKYGSLIPMQAERNYVRKIPADAAAVAKGFAQFAGKSLGDYAQLQGAYNEQLGSEYAGVAGDVKGSKQLEDMGTRAENYGVPAFTDDVKQFANGLTGGPNGAPAKTLRAISYLAKGHPQVAADTFQNVVNGIGQEAWNEPVQSALAWAGAHGVAAVAEAGVRGAALASVRGGLEKVVADDSVPADVRAAAKAQMAQLDTAQGIYRQWRTIQETRANSPAQLAGRDAMMSGADADQLAGHTFTVPGEEPTPTPPTYPKAQTPAANGKPTVQLYTHKGGSAPPSTVPASTFETPTSSGWVSPDAATAVKGGTSTPSPTAPPPSTISTAAPVGTMAAQRSLTAGLQRTNGFGSIVLKDGSEVPMNPSSRTVDQNGTVSALDGAAYHVDDIAAVRDHQGRVVWQNRQLSNSTMPPTSTDVRPSSNQDAGSATTATFTTAKGSTYELNGDGTTTRNKAFRPEQGRLSRGLQPRSELTVYATPDDARALSLPAGQFRFVVRNGAATVITPTSTEGRWGAATSQRDVPVSVTPAKGLLPIELWNKDGSINGAFRKVHFGNEIIDVQGGTTPAGTKPTVRVPMATGPGSEPSTPSPAGAAPSTAQPVYTSPTRTPNTQLDRAFVAGSNQGRMVFTSPLQRDLYDLGAKIRYQMRGGQNLTSDRLVGDIDGLRNSIAQHLGVTPHEAGNLGLSVHADVKAQMKGVKDGEVRTLSDSGLIPTPKPATAPTRSTTPSGPGLAQAGAMAEARPPTPPSPAAAASMPGGPGNPFTTSTPSGPSTPPDMAGSINMGHVSPNAQEPIRASVRAQGLDQREPVSLEDIRRDARALGLQVDHLRDLTPGHIPSPDIHPNVFTMAVRDLSDHQAGVVKSAERAYQENPSKSNTAALDTASQDLALTVLHRNALSNGAGVGLRALGVDSEPFRSFVSGDIFGPKQGPTPTRASIVQYGAANNRLFTKQDLDAGLADFQKRLKAAGGRLNAGLDPTILAPLVKVGGFYVEAGLRRFADWAKQMKSHVGDAITDDQLKQVWNAVRPEATRRASAMNSPKEATRDFLLGTTTDPARIAAITRDLAAIKENPDGSLSNKARYQLAELGSKHAGQGYLDNDAHAVRAGLLSGPATLGKVALSHLLALASEEFLTRPIAAGLDRARVAVKGGNRAVHGLTLQDATASFGAGARSARDAGAILAHGENQAILAGKVPWHDGELRPEYTGGAFPGAGKLADYLPPGALKTAANRVNSAANAVVRVPMRSHAALYHMIGSGIWERGMREAATLEAQAEAKAGYITQAEIPGRVRDLRAKPTADMLDHAKAFHDEQMFTNKTRGKKYIDEANVGEYGTLWKAAATALAPFPRVPSNIVGRALETSPAGVLHFSAQYSRMLKSGKPLTSADHAALARTAARVLHGTGGIALGYYLAKHGIVHGPDTKNGEYGPTVNAFGRKWEVGGLAPATGPIGYGATAYDLMHRSTDERHANPMTDAGQMLFGDSPYMRPAEALAAAANGDPKAGPRFAGNLIGMRVPTISAEIAAHFDPAHSVRSKTSALDYVANRIPGPATSIGGQAVTRQALPVAHDEFGRTFPEAGGFAPVRSAPANASRPLTPAENAVQAAQMARDHIKTALAQPAIHGSVDDDHLRQQLAIADRQLSHALAPWYNTHFAQKNGIAPRMSDVDRRNYEARLPLIVVKTLNKLADIEKQRAALRQANASTSQNVMSWFINSQAAPGAGARK